MKKIRLSENIIGGPVNKELQSRTQDHSIPKQRKNAAAAMMLFLVLVAVLILFTALQRGLSGKGTDPAAFGADSWEVHLLLDSAKVLDEDHLLRKEIQERFAVEKKPDLFGLMYLETPERAFNAENWINRVRMRENKPEKGIRLTYKKRYSVPGEDLGAAMDLAASEGFERTDESWKAQVEWGYSGMTLSISSEADLPGEEYKGIADVGPEKAAAMLRDNMPAKEQNWKADRWGIRMMESAGAAGPVFFHRYQGEYAGRELKIEVWEIPDPDGGAPRFLSELSFEAKEYQEAAALREELIARLAEQGILVKADSLKTGQILDAYIP